ncbi:MAG TPA: carboxyl transferase domain-containing protein, partial [Terriglobia bacterium]|nr:carboxyl transferase domain-containing protein [Terriglobia bacterium]
IVYRKELSEAADVAEERLRRVQEFKDRFANPYLAAERGYIDEVIQPRDTRRKLIAALTMLDTKRDKNPPKKHGNIPL